MSACFTSLECLIVLRRENHPISVQNIMKMIIFQKISGNDMDGLMVFSLIVCGRSRNFNSLKVLNYRQIEKRILDRILSPSIYDNQIREHLQSSSSLLQYLLHINHIHFKLFIKFLNGNFSVLTFIKCRHFIMEIFNWRPLIYMSLSLIYNPSIIKLLKNEGEQSLQTQGSFRQCY